MTALDIGVVAKNVLRGDGQGRVTVEVVRAMIERGHRVTVYSHALDDALHEATHLRVIPPTPGPVIADDIVFLLRATRAVRRAHHDLVLTVGPTAFPRGRSIFHTQFSHAGWRASWTPATRPPRLHRSHAAVAARLESAGARRASAVLATTVTVGIETAGPIGERLLVAPVGIDHDEFAPPTEEERAEARHVLGLDRGAFVVGFLGGYATGRKGLDPLIAALALPDGRPRPHLVVAGSGPAARVATLADRLGVAADITLAGFRSSRLVLAASDAVAVPSTYEPVSLVALEAAAGGLPVVISRCAGAAELLGDGAVIVDDPGDPVALRRALDMLRDDPATARAIGEAGRRAVAGLTWARSAGIAVDHIEAVALGRGVVHA